VDFFVGPETREAAVDLAVQGVLQGKKAVHKADVTAGGFFNAISEWF
jgi:hypothetical protein